MLVFFCCTEFICDLYTDAYYSVSICQGLCPRSMGSLWKSLSFPPSPDNAWWNKSVLCPFHFKNRSRVFCTNHITFSKIQLDLELRLLPIYPKETPLAPGAPGAFPAHLSEGGLLRLLTSCPILVSGFPSHFLLVARALAHISFRYFDPRYPSLTSVVFTV